MGELITFPQGAQRERQSLVEIDAAERGRILFYTGVRIERMVEPPREPLPDDRPQGRRRRKA